MTKITLEVGDLFSVWQTARWMISDTNATIAEIAAAEKINESYVGRVLRLTLLAPDIVEAILGGRQPADLQLRRVPVLWAEQR